MAYSSSSLNVNSKLSDASVEIKAYDQGLKKVEAQLVVHQQNQLWYEQKIKFMKIDLDDKTDVLTYHKKLLAEALKEKEDLKTKFENWQSSSKNLGKLLNTQMSANDKFGLGYGDHRFDGILSYENEVLQSVFMNNDSNTNDRTFYDRFVTTDGMHAVPPPMTGNYIPSGPDIKIDESQFTCGPKQTKPSESNTRSSNFDSCESNTSVEIKAYDQGFKKVEAQLVTHQQNQLWYEQKIKFMKIDLDDKTDVLTYHKKLLAEAVKEKEELQAKLESFKTSSKSLNTLLNSQLSVNDKAGFGHNGAKESKVSETITSVSKAETSNSETSNDKVEMPKIETVRMSELIIEEWESNSEDDEIMVKPKEVTKTVKPSCEKIESINARNETVRQVENPRKNNKRPRGNKRNWNGMMTHKLGKNFEFNNKACYVCGSFDHLHYTCKHKRNHQKQVKPVWNNSKRVNHQNFGRFSHPNPKSNIVPQALLTKSGLVSLNTAKSVRTAQPRTRMNDAMQKPYSYYKAYSSVKRPFNKKTTNYNRYFNKRVNTVKSTRVNSARPNAEVNTVKASASWVWKPKHKDLDHVSKSNSASKTLTRYDYVDALGRKREVSHVFLVWFGHTKEKKESPKVGLGCLMSERKAESKLGLVDVENDTEGYGSYVYTGLVLCDGPRHVSGSDWWFDKGRIRDSTACCHELVPLVFTVSTALYRVSTARICDKLAIPGQTTTGKESSNPFMAGSLPKTIHFCDSLQSDEDSFELIELMILCTNFLTMVRDLENLKNHSSDNEKKSLGEDASKQGRIDDADAEVTFIDETLNDARNKNNKISNSKVEDDKETALEVKKCLDTSSW
ncbi:hypothetical protein Tco_0563429 [Tanacetum coccineum]